MIACCFESKCIANKKKIQRAKKWSDLYWTGDSTPGTLGTLRRVHQSLNLKITKQWVQSSEWILDLQFQSGNASINVKPHYPQYGEKWAGG